MRLNKYLAQCGIGSRRKVEPYIQDGRVTVNGEVMTQMSYRVHPTDKVEFDGKLCYPPSEETMVLLNKPKRYLCTKDDPQGRPTVFELLPENLRHLHYIGRLDFDSRGLLLFTDNGELSRRLTHPSYGVQRMYKVKLDKVLQEKDAQEIRKGLILEDGTEFRPAKVKIFEENVEMILTEGKKREIREMMKALGYRVVDLKREVYAGVRLGKLREGNAQILDRDVVAKLRKLVGLD